MILVLAPMCMSACGRMVKMFSWHLMDLLNMECQQLGKSSWQGFYTISHQFWHLQLQFQTGEHQIPKFYNNSQLPIFAFDLISSYGHQITLIKLGNHLEKVLVLCTHNIYAYDMSSLYACPVHWPVDYLFHCLIISSRSCVLFFKVSIPCSLDS